MMSMGCSSVHTRGVFKDFLKLGSQNGPPLAWVSKGSLQLLLLLGPPVVPFYPFLGEGSPTKIDYRRNIGYLYSNLSTRGRDLVGIR